MRSLTYLEVDVPEFVLAEVTAALLHFDGADASTTFTDETGKTWTANGNAQIDTAESVFGGASGLFDGSGDFISTPDHADFVLGSNDFTIEAWFNVDVGASSTRTIAGQTDSGFNAAASSFMVRRESDGTLTARVSDGSSFTTISGTTVFTDTDNPGWHHLAFIRSGNDLELRIDGQLEASGSFSGSVNDSSEDLNIGARHNASDTYWQGWIDEFRLVAGKAAWTEDFTPPSAAYSMEETFRFARDTGYNPRTIEAFPAIADLSFTPARISLGENLGERAALDVTFNDFRHIFDGEDFDAGSFFGKWRARYGLRVLANDLRWYQGDDSQALVDMTERHFVIEGAEGPSLDGKYKLTAKDIIKFADSDRAQAPAVSSGFITGDISDSATAVTLSPAGIGDAEYPASGFVCIGGNEICAFTRSGDDLTISRGDLGTTASSHDSGDRAQLVLRYDGEDPADIIRDLVVNYTDIPESYVDLDAWKSETESFLQRLYTTTLPEPTGVAKLISELVEQAALAIWTDLTGPRIRLQVLREISTDAARFDDRNIIEDSLSIKEQPGKRISQVWTFFGQRDPTEPLDEARNYRSVAVDIDTEAEVDYGQPKIKRIYSRWIPFGARAVAERVNAIQLARFRDPPRRFAWKVMRGGEIMPVMGGGYRLEAWPIQTTAGAQSDAPVQVIRVNPGDDLVAVEADEMLFAAPPVDLVNRVIIIDADSFNLNGRALHDQIYPEPTGDESPEISITFVIESNVIVGSTDVGVPAFDTGDWPAGIVPQVRVRGRIQGKGGDGSTQGSLIPEDGGTALFARAPIDLLLDEGDAELWGGGGGGGDVPGGGGAGTLPGAGGVFNGDEAGDGTSESGGDPDGGDPGQDGEDGETSGGAAGAAIDGVSNVTKTGAGDILGPEIN